MPMIADFKEVFMIDLASSSSLDVYESLKRSRCCKIPAYISIYENLKHTVW